MAHHLVDLGVPLVSLDLQQDGGAAWNCRTGPAGTECAAHASPATPRDRIWRIELGPGVDGHDGRYFVGPTTASPPAAG